MSRISLNRCLFIAADTIDTKVKPQQQWTPGAWRTSFQPNHQSPGSKQVNSATLCPLWVRQMGWFHSLQGSVSRAIRLKDSSRGWAKAKTACLQHLCVTEKGLVGCTMISIHRCTHTTIQTALLIGDYYKNNRGAWGFVAQKVGHD